MATKTQKSPQKPSKVEAPTTKQTTPLRPLPASKQNTTPNRPLPNKQETPNRPLPAVKQNTTPNRPLPNKLETPNRPLPTKDTTTPSSIDSSTKKKKQPKWLLNKKKLKSPQLPPPSSPVSAFTNKVVSQVQSINKSTPTEHKFVIIGVIIAVIAFFLQVRYFTPVYTPTITPHLSNDLVKWNKKVWSPFRTKFIEILSTCCGWDKVNFPINATLIWVRDDSELPEYFDYEWLGKGKIINQIPLAHDLGNKGNLHRLLADTNKTHIKPETYVFTNTQECTQFFKLYEKDPNSKWIAKSNNIRGVYDLPGIDRLRKDFLFDPKATGDRIQCKAIPWEDELMVQRRISPLTIEGKAVEFRSYWAIASVEPYVVVYHDGVAHTSESIFNEQRWIFEDVAKYLQSNNKVKDGDDWLRNKLRPQLKQIISHVASAVRSFLVQGKEEPQVWDGRFELLAADVILDDSLNPHLLEVQLGPSLSIEPGMPVTFITDMIEELIDIVLEVDIKQRYYKSTPLSASSLTSLRNWQPIDYYEIPTN